MACYGVPIGFVVIGYAVFGYGLFDMKVIIRKGLVYSTLIACITAVYLVMVLIMERWFQGFFGYRSFVSTLIVATFIAVFFNPLRNRIQAFVDRAVLKATPVELAEQRERLLTEVRKTDQLRAVSTLAAGMAHEIKNPLTAIKTFTEFLPEKYDDPDFRAKFHRIVGGEVNRINHLVQRLLEFSRPAPPQLAPVRISEIAQETVECLSATLVQQRIQVETSFTELDEVLADRGQLKQALLNILLNGIEAMEPGGRLSVSTAQRDSVVEVVIEDTGRGIPQEALSRVFDPFYSTKERGTGLGLSIVHTIITEHGGRIALKSRPGLGTRCTLRFPLIAEDATAAVNPTPVTANGSA